MQSGRFSKRSLSFQQCTHLAESEPEAARPLVIAYRGCPQIPIDIGRDPSVKCVLVRKGAYKHTSGLLRTYVKAAPNTLYRFILINPGDSISIELELFPISPLCLSHTVSSSIAEVVG